MGVFGGVGKASGSRGGEYILPGDYVFRVDRCKEQGGQKNKKDVFFIGEMTVMQGTLADGTEVPAGTKRSFVVKLEPVEYPDLALGNVADYMRAGLAALATAQEQECPELEDLEGWEDILDEEMAESIVGEDNTISGAFVHCHAFNKKTRKDTDFTRTVWTIPECGSGPTTGFT